MQSGFMLVNKPKTWTSHDVVDYLRKITHIKKIGHSGTLDPFAEGLLILAIGREATKQIDEFKKLDKTYVAKICLGFKTDNQDKTGEKTKISDKIPSQDEVLDALKKFEEVKEQIPPMYSAKKNKGKKLYELARVGKEIERKPIKITIYEIKLLKYLYPYIDMEVMVSTGTYIRTLAEDLGEKLGTGAYCEELKRTKIGGFSIKGAHEPKEINSNNWTKFLTI